MTSSRTASSALDFEPVTIPTYILAASALLRLAQPLFYAIEFTPMELKHDLALWRTLRGFARMLLERGALELSLPEACELRGTLRHCQPGRDVDFCANCNSMRGASIMALKVDRGPLVERELLIERICEWTRTHDRRLRPDDEFKLRLHLRTESIEALRALFEEKLPRNARLKWPVLNRRAGPHFYLFSNRSEDHMKLGKLKS